MKRRRVVTGLLLAAGSVAGTIFYRRKPAKRRERVDVYFEDGSVQWEDEAGEVRTLAFEDAIMNIKKNNQQRAAIAVHRDSNYGH